MFEADKTTYTGINMTPHKPYIIMQAYIILFFYNISKLNFWVISYRTSDLNIQFDKGNEHVLVCITLCVWNGENDKNSRKRGIEGDEKAGNKEFGLVWVHSNP